MNKAKSEAQKKIWTSSERREKTSGSKNGWWKEEVGYHGLHARIYRKLGRPTSCEHCNKKRLVRGKIHWANKSGKYKDELTDWIRLCVPCHKKYDTQRLTFIKQ